MKVRFTTEALDDLLQIGESIEAYSEASAARITNAIAEACLALNDMPMRYPLVPAFERYGIRRRPHGDYLIFYKIFDGEVAIIHVLHGARDYEPLLFPEA